MTDNNDNNGFDVSRRKILGSMATVGVASAGAGAGTMAYFSDTESSTGNLIQAGTLDLQVENSDSAVTTIDISDVAPGDSGSDSSSLSNEGSLDGKLSAVFGSGSNGEGNNPDSDTNTTDPGDLGDVLQVTVKIGGTTIRQGTFNAVFDGTREWYDPGVSLNAGNSKDLTIDYTVPSWVGNDVQGDQVTADLDIELLQQSAPPESLADVVVDQAGGADATTIDAGEDMAGQDDTILVKDGPYSGGWVDIKTQGVSLVAESRHGVTCNNTITVERSDVAVLGFEVKGGYEGISVEPDDGASTGTVIADNHIHEITDDGDDGSGNESGKDESFGILAWSSGSNMEDIVIRDNTIENVGRVGSQTYSSQGYGVFVEGLSFGTGGATIENNTIDNIKGGTQDGDTYPGVGVIVLPEYTNPNETGGSGVGVGEANASVTTNTFSNTEVDVSVAGNIDQLVVADNTFNDSNFNVFTQGAVPNLGSIGIMNVTDSGIQDSVVSGTARYIQ